MAGQVNFRLPNAVGFCAVLVIAIVLLRIEPAFAQFKPTFHLGQETKDPAVEAYRKQQEEEYNSVVRKIPDGKKKSSDPWGNVRGAEPAKK
jgi:hypothetical protein